MIIMIQMKLSPHPFLKKNDIIEMFISVPMVALGLIMLYRSFIYEVLLSDKYDRMTIVESTYLRWHPEFNIVHGLWTIPLCLGIVLFLDSVRIIPNVKTKLLIKNAIKYLKWKIKKGVMEYIEWKC